MLEQIVNNFYFTRILYIALVILFAFSIINDLRNKHKIEVKKYLNIRKLNISLLLKYLFLSFIIRILLEQLVIYLHVPTTDIQIPSMFFEIIVEFITICILAPIFEEIVFRFGLYKKLNKKFNAFISMLIISLVFTIMHFYNVDGFIILIGISLVWNYSFYKTDNLFYPILLHFFHNIYAFSNNWFDYDSYWYILLFINAFGYIILTLKKQKN